MWNGSLIYVISMAANILKLTQSNLNFMQYSLILVP